MKDYKLEVRVTMICFILVAVTGGFLSAFFVIFNQFFFNEVAVPAHLAHALKSYFVVKTTVMGFPLHYLLLILLSWIGATLIGAIWSLVMDKIEDRQQT
jgi:succinate dehydrogenase/fumarate reductase cytochrome b subunit